jgi:hypothetical protein
MVVRQTVKVPQHVSWTFGRQVPGAIPRESVESHRGKLGHLGSTHVLTHVAPGSSSGISNPLATQRHQARHGSFSTRAKVCSLGQERRWRLLDGWSVSGPVAIQLLQYQLRIVRRRGEGARRHRRRGQGLPLPRDHPYCHVAAGVHAAARRTRRASEAASDSLAWRSSTVPMKA